MMPVSFRCITDADKPIIDEWISRDPDHVARSMTSQFFFEPGFSFAIVDYRDVIMFVRIDRKAADPERATIHIQFNQGHRRRTVAALLTGFPTVCEKLKAAGISTLVFDSVSPTLIAFCQKHIGFISDPDNPGQYIASI